MIEIGDEVVPLRHGHLIVAPIVHQSDVAGAGGAVLVGVLPLLVFGQSGGATIGLPLTYATSALRTLSTQ